MAKRRLKQQRIPGTEPDTITEVTRAAEEYIEARDSRMASLKLEVAAADTLLDLMHSHKVKDYEMDGRVALTTISEEEAMAAYARFVGQAGIKELIAGLAMVQASALDDKTKLLLVRGLAIKLTIKVMEAANAD